MTINVHIERLIVDGLSVKGGQGTQIQQAVERELAKLLAAGELQNTWQSGRNVHYLETAGIQVAQETKPTRLGEQIAGAVYGGLSK
jgi:hypothetical protein